MVDFEEAFIKSAISSFEKRATVIRVRTLERICGSAKHLFVTGNWRSLMWSRLDQ